MGDIPASGWIVFGGSLSVLLFLDLFIHRGGRRSGRGAAIGWSVVWISAGLSFCAYIWVTMGGQSAQEYLAAYLIEKSLSLDNLFVFLVIFRSLKIPSRYQHTVLWWGIFGALVFRAIFIFAGVAAIERFVWVTYAFAIVLAIAAVRIAREDPAESMENKIVAWLARHLPVTQRIEGPAFLAGPRGARVATPLLVALMGLEMTDILFAIDSVPAAFAVTREPFLLYSSNAFAILGLRALYLVLAHTIAELKYLHLGLAGVLLFAAIKIGLNQILEIPPWLSILVIVAILLPAILLSLRWRKLHPDENEERIRRHRVAGGEEPGESRR